MLKPKWGWLLAFTAVFAVLAGFVFWGAWSLDFTPVMPDNATVHSMVYGDYVDMTLRKFWTAGKFVPSDILWDGLLFSPYFCQELKYAVSLFCSGLGLAYFLRGRGLSYLASYGAGLLLAFCGYWASLFSAGHGGWFVWMTFGVFAFGLADRAVRGNRTFHWLMLGACVAWGSFYQSDLWLLFTVFTGLYFVWCCVRERTFPWKGMLLAGVALFAIGAPSFRSAITGDLAGRDEQIKKGETVTPGAAKNEAENRWIFTTNWSLPPDETAEFFIPRLNGDTSCPLTLSIGMRHGSGIKPYTGALGRPKDAKEGNYRQHCLYVGWITCLLALLGGFGRLGVWASGRSADGKASRRLRSDIPFFVVAAVVFWLFSLGRYCEPVYRIVYALPFGDYLRAPVKWHHLTELSLAVLAGYGIEALVNFFERVKFPSFNAHHSSFITHHSSLIIPIAVVLIGAFDVARIDKLFCAPVDLRQVRKTNSGMQMSVLRRQDFANPQVAEMVKRGYVVSLANYLGNPDLYLVEVLQPRSPSTPREPLPPMTVATWLGFLSVCSTLAIGAYALMAAYGNFRNGNSRKSDVL